MRRLVTNLLMVEELAGRRARTDIQAEIQTSCPQSLLYHPACLSTSRHGLCPAGSHSLLVGHYVPCNWVIGPLNINESSGEPPSYKSPSDIGWGLILIRSCLRWSIRGMHSSRSMYGPFLLRLSTAIPVAGTAPSRTVAGHPWHLHCFPRKALWCHCQQTWAFVVYVASTKPGLVG